MMSRGKESKSVEANGKNWTRKKEAKAIPVNRPWRTIGL
jgi:hypothetical protein